MNAQAWYQNGLEIDDVLSRGYYFRKGEQNPDLRPWALIGLATVA